MVGIFGEFFSGLRFPQNEARKLLKQFGEKFGAKKFGRKNSGNFRTATFLTSRESANRFARIGPSKLRLNIAFKDAHGGGSYSAKRHVSGFWAPSMTPLLAEAEAPWKTQGSVSFLGPRTLRAQRLKNFNIALRDWIFQARLIISSEPPFFVGNSEGRDWNFQSRFKFSIEIENFKRDWNFSIFGKKELGSRLPGTRPRFLDFP